MGINYVSGFHGAVVADLAPANGIYAGAVLSFTISRRMATKDINPFGGNRFNISRGGILKLSGTIMLALQFGAASTDPNWVSPDYNGDASLTLTFETGCTLTGSALFPQLDVNEAYADPAIFGSQTYEFTGTVTEAWAVT